MRFMILIKADEDTEAGVLPSQQLLTEMGAYNEQLVNAGVMVAGEGLHPSSRGVRVRFSGGPTTVIDGPIAETKELIAGFWLIQAASMADAIEWVTRYPYPRDRDAQYEIEIRPVFGAEDFAEVMTPELRQQEERLRARATELNLAATRS